MARTTLIPPDSYTKLPTTRDENSEAGWSFKRIVDAINSMFTSIAGGTTVVDFGAYPGAFDTSATITGQTDIVAGSTIDAWVVATATSDHSIDEHWVDPPVIVIGNISPGVGFTIYATPRDQNRLYGQYTVQWQWI